MTGAVQNQTSDAASDTPYKRMKTEIALPTDAVRGWIEEDNVIVSYIKLIETHSHNVYQWQYCEIFLPIELSVCGSLASSSSYLANDGAEFSRILSRACLAWYNFLSKFNG